MNTKSTVLITKKDKNVNWRKEDVDYLVELLLLSLPLARYRNIRPNAPAENIHLCIWLVEVIA